MRTVVFLFIWCVLCSTILACVDTPLAQREDHADVVFTATVRSLQADDYNAAMTVAEVEVKRVMKGKHIVHNLPQLLRSGANPQNRHVLVYGIGNPYICDSLLRRHDTRIFLLKLDEHQRLTLNSSIVRLNLNNIRRTEAAVSNAPFQKDSPYSRNLDPCQRIYCGYGGVCQLDVRTGKPACTCPHTCRSGTGNTVCGSDDNTYDSECHLVMETCRRQRNIYVTSQGPCDPCKDHQCGPSQTCQLGPDRRPACKCQGIGMCPSQFAPVCGSDGRTYSNECILKVEACKWRQDIRVVFRGECGKAATALEANNRAAATGSEGGDDTENKISQSSVNPCESIVCGAWEECRIDRQGIPQCQCPLPCEQVVRPVCGSDDKTYDNECEMKKTACDEKRVITISYRGSCEKDGPCSVYKCDYGATCVVKDDEPACECPQCVDNIDPVCGSDGISYSNQCKLKLENCLKKTSIQIKQRGHCNGCESLQCDYNSICQSNESGTRCVCPSSCVQTDAKVCGTDGVTYLNECELKVASCNKLQFIMVASYGQCDRCADVKCRNGARCEQGRCVCPQVCPADYSPICGSDGETYSNQCVMMRSACVRDVELKVVHHGGCKSAPPTGELENKEPIQGSGTMPESGFEICDENTCRFGGICDQDTEGEFGCICNFLCQDERNEAVCGNDGTMYQNVCHMREASCIKQTDITALPLTSCQGIDRPCDGHPPRANPLTGKELDCSPGRDTCPPGSYCHKGLTYAKCCLENEPVRTCNDSLYGCCPDGKTASPGPYNSGCPSMCQCNALGSFGSTCDPINLQCECKPGVGGKHCNRCNPGYWGMTKIDKGALGCSSCNCNAYGSTREDCEQMTGRCICKPGIKGTKCNICPDGTELGAGGCASDSDGPKDCEDTLCNLGSTCEMQDGKPQCICQACSRETNDQQFVCGTDGQTYGSECQLRHLACRLTKDISVQYDGACRDRSRSDSTPRPYYTRSRITTRHLLPSSRTTKARSLTMPTIDTPILSKYGKKNSPRSREPRQGNSRQFESIRAQTDDFYYKDTAIIVPQFSGHSYMELKRIPLANKDMTIDIDFRTLNKDGIILYTGDERNKSRDFLSLTVRDGYAEFRFDLGSGPVVIRSKDKVELRKFHHVTIHRSGRTGILKLDHGEVMGTSLGDSRALNLKDPIYIGYLPQAMLRVLREIDVEVGLVGCIQTLKITIDDVVKEYNLVYPESADIATAVELAECGNNPCNSLPCQNGGLCLSQDETNYKCLCEPGYEGESCSVPVDPCKAGRCAQGSTCRNLPNGKYECHCSIGQKGAHCDQIDFRFHSEFVPEFNGLSYIEYRYHDNAYTRINFEVWFLSKEENGVLLYNGQAQDASGMAGDYLSLNLNNGFLEFKFNLGSGSAYIRSAKKVELNRWHKVYIDRDKQDGVMILDDEDKVQGRSKVVTGFPNPTMKGLLQSLNMDQVLYVGGVKDQFLVNPDSGVKDGLKGAIQRLYINKRYIENLAQDAAGIDGIIPYAGAPCDQNPCLNGGTCQPVLNQVKCKCTMKFGGSFCESDLNEMNRERSIRPVQFDGRTYLQYYNNIQDREFGQKKNRFQVTFITSADNGIILIQHKSSHISGDYLSLALVGGRVELSFQLGKQETLFRLRAPQLVNDGRWHTVIATRDHQRGSIQVDNYDAVAAVTSVDTTQLDTDGYLWIGGKRHLPRGLPLHYYNGFAGCISEFSVNGTFIDMVRRRKNQVSIVFCDK